MPSRLKTGEKLVGINQVRKAITNGKAKSVFVAEDAERRVIAPILEMCSKSNVELIRIPTMKQLGEACGIGVGAAAAALLS